MKSLILLLVFCILQVYATVEKRSSNSSPQNDQDGDDICLGFSEENIHLCKNMIDNYVNYMINSRHLGRYLDQSKCKETQINNQLLALTTKIDALNDQNKQQGERLENSTASNMDNAASLTNTLNEKLEMIQQHESDSTTKLENALKEIEVRMSLKFMEKQKELNDTLNEIEARLSLKFMQEKEINNTLMASRFIEISETANRIENLINISEQRIKETVKVHSDLNSILVENATSLNMDNAASLTNILNEKLEMIQQRENDSTTKLENALKEIETRMSLKFVEKQKELNATLRIFSAETRNHLRSLENLINTKENSIKQHENDSTTKLKNALKEIETRMSLKFVEKQKELNDAMRIISVDNRNRQLALENLINTKERSIKSELTFELAKTHIRFGILLNKVPTDFVRIVRLSTGVYLFVNIKKSWSDSRKHCQDRGMDLVAIETEAEDKALMQHARSMEGRISDYAHTSGCYSTASNSFVWRSTGHPLSYTNWASGKPTATSDSQCIQINSSVNKWADYSDSEPFICEFI